MPEKIPGKYQTDFRFGLVTLITLINHPYGGQTHLSLADQH